MSKTTKLICLILVILLVIPLSHALSLDEEPEECENIEFYIPSTWISCGLAKMYQNAVDFLIMPYGSLQQLTLKKEGSQKSKPSTYFLFSVLNFVGLPVSLPKTLILIGLRR